MNRLEESSAAPSPCRGYNTDYLACPARRLWLAERPVNPWLAALEQGPIRGAA